MGTADIAVPILRALCALPGVEVAGVVSQPDRPKGRKLVQTPSAVKLAALELGLPVQTPEQVNTPESVAALGAWRPDVMVVVAYGQILREPLLRLPPRGCVNVHASLLPRYRGAAPIQWAIARGDVVTGVTTMLMNARMDAGDMLLQQTVAIGPEDTAGVLQVRLAAAGADLLARTLPAWMSGTLVPRPQDETLATLAPKLHKGDGEINWTLSATEIYNRVRGFNPWPGAYCLVPEVSDAGAAPTVLKVRRVAVESGTGEPGCVLDVGGGGPLVAAGSGALRLLDVQAPGGKAMAGEAYLRGRPLRVGTRLGR